MKPRPASRARFRFAWSTAAMVGVALTASLVAQPAAPIPVPPIATGRRAQPGPDQLPDRPALPELLVSANGARVATVRQWQVRRNEIAQVLTHYAVGAMPPAPPRVMVAELQARTVLDGTVRYRLLHLTFGPRNTLGFDVAVFTPVTGSRFPTVLFPSFSPTPGATPLPTLVRPPEQGKGVDALTVPIGDQASRAAAAASETPAVASPAAQTSDPAAVAESHRELFRRGYALVTWNYQDTGEDTIGRNSDGSWAFRTSRFFPAYPEFDWGLVGAWAWGMSRVVDYLQDAPFADRSKLILTGHSRVGKAVLVAGAFDSRIALVAPAGSGAGGTGAYRFNGAGRGGREGLDDMLRKYPNWFSPHLYPFRGRVERLPFDQHWFIAMVAPRAFISLEGTDDQNCVPYALEQAWRAAMSVYALHGVEARLGVNYATHRHAMHEDDWVALLDYADLQLQGLPIARRFDRFPPAER